MSFLKILSGISSVCILFIYLAIYLPVRQLMCLFLFLFFFCKQYAYLFIFLSDCMSAIASLYR